ncbi:MAG TPA: glycosyltransferase [Pyrinomonadaceae bacterium]|nr:glycosyltransferase [Pyrinomonadaceae bacterium]
MVEQLSDRIDFYVVTRNYDSRTDTRPFTNVPSDKWTTFEKAKVFYFSPGKLTPALIDETIAHANPSVVFVNSIFSKPSILFLWQRLRKFPSQKVLISPCGELMPESLRKKKLKKTIFLFLANSLGLYRSAFWRASSDREMTTILERIGAHANITVIPEIVSHNTLKTFDISKKPEKTIGSVRFVHVARVVPGKNLLFLLEMFSNITEGMVELTIIGPAEDIGYWDECKAMIAKLPANIKVKWTGPLPNTEVMDHLRNAHFFSLPTTTENFGYAFLEALSAGCPLLISDTTDWNEIGSAGAGWALSLDDHESWLSRIEACIQIDADAYTLMSKNARSYAENWMKNSDSVSLMYSMFAQTGEPSKSE